MALNVYEREKKALEMKIQELIDGSEEIINSKEPMTDEQRIDVADSVKKIKTLQKELDETNANLKMLQEVEDLGRQIGPSTNMSVVSEPNDNLMNRLNDTPQGMFMKSLGEQFVESAGYKSAVNAYRESGGRLPMNYSTGPMELQTKGTLTGLDAGGAGATHNVPQLLPGIVDIPQLPLTFSNLILEGQASTSSIRYIVEGTATNAAAGVAEAGLKPESALGFVTTDETIRKIATILPVSEETLEDAPAIQSYINGRLSLFVQLQEESQLLRGAADGVSVQGLLTGRNVATYTGSTATDGDYAAQLFTAMNSMRGSSYLEPDWVVMHPTDYQKLRLLKDANNQYMGGGPFLGAYGAGGPVSAAPSNIAGPTEFVWGKQVYVTAAVGNAGSAVIGTRANAQVWRRGGISVEATNSHSTYFQYNLVAIRAEERVGLAVYRPKGYVILKFGS